MNLSRLNRIIELLRRLFDANSATAPLLPFSPQKPPCVCKKNAQPLDRVSPEKEGVSSELLCEYVSALFGSKTTGQQSVIIAKNGKIICEVGAHNDVWKNTYSACKSITSIAIGMLMDERKLKATSKVLELLPEYATPLNRLKAGELTIKHLLTMTSCVSFNEAQSLTEKDWAHGYFNSAIKGKVGKTFGYNSLNSYVLSLIVRKVSGESLTEYLTPRLFEPLGISCFFWEKCPAGIEKGGWGLYLCPEDMAKIGIMLLNGGMWNGKRIVSQRWIFAATKKQAEAPADYGDFDYGYHIWVSRNSNAFLFNGMMGQNMLCFRDSNLVVMSNAGNGDIFQQNEFFALTERFFGNNAAALLASSDSSKSRHLKALCKSLSFPQTKKMPFDLRSRLGGKRFVATEKYAVSIGMFPVLLQAVQSSYSSGTRAISFDIISGKFFMNYEENEVVHRLEIGFKKDVTTSLDFNGEEYLVGAFGRFVYDEYDRQVFKITLSFLETPCIRTIKLFFEGDKIFAELSETPGFELMKKGVMLVEQGIKENALGAGALSKIDPDFVDYKIERLFKPSLKLEEKKC